MIETVKKLGWPPDIIHCHDWMTSFIPLYLRTNYEDDPMFSNTKIVFTVYDNGFESNLAQDYLEKVKVDGINGDALNQYNDSSYAGVVKGGMALSDVVTKGMPQIDASIEDYITSNQSEPFYFDAEDKDSYIEGYHQLYADISSN